MSIKKSFLVLCAAGLGLNSVMCVAGEAATQAVDRDIAKARSQQANPTRIAAPARPALSPEEAARIKATQDACEAVMRQKLAEMQASHRRRSVAPAAVQAHSDPKPASPAAAPVMAATPAPAPAPAPMAAMKPAAPAPVTRAERLEALLQKYRADAVTPQQYQDERAKILAETQNEK